MLGALVKSKMPGEVRVLPSPFELEGGYLAGEASDKEGHLPRTTFVPFGTLSTPDGFAIVLSETTRRVWGGANIGQDALAIGNGTQQIDAVERWDGSLVHSRYLL